MSQTVHRCPCVFDTVARCGTCGGCHCLRVSADTPLTALRRAPSAPGQDHELTWLCMQVSCMGIVYGNFTAPVADWVCGGLSRSESSAACDTGHRRKGSVWLRAWQVLDTLPSHPPPPPPKGDTIPGLGKCRAYVATFARCNPFVGPVSQSA